MFDALAEFERSLIRERTQAGLAAARRAGRTGGRPPKLTDDDIEAAKAMLANRDIGVTQIAHRLGVSPATLYRYIPPHEPRIPQTVERGAPQRPDAPRVVRAVSVECRQWVESGPSRRRIRVTGLCRERPFLVGFLSVGLLIVMTPQ
jgi:predicted DNA-binding transcriptional regulator AlpA